MFIATELLMPCDYKLTTKANSLCSRDTSFEHVNDYHEEHIVCDDDM